MFVEKQSINQKSKPQSKNFENNILHNQSINQNIETNPKKTKSTVYKFKNIPPIIFGKNENNSSMISETKGPMNKFMGRRQNGTEMPCISVPSQSDKEIITHLRDNSDKNNEARGFDLQTNQSHIESSIKTNFESGFPASTLFEKNSEAEKQISYCPNCEVEILPNSIRRYRLGYIEFTYPVTHIWYLSSYIPLLLNLPRNFVEGIAECHESFSSGFPPLSAWSYNGLEPISWTFQNQLLEYPIHFNFCHSLRRAPHVKISNLTTERDLKLKNTLNFSSSQSNKQNSFGEFYPSSNHHEKTQGKGVLRALKNYDE